MNRILLAAGEGLIALMVLTGVVLAQPLNVMTLKPSYGPGEAVGLSTTITNDAAVPRTLVLEVNIKGSDLSLPPAPLRIPVALAPHEQKTLILSPLVTDDGTSPGNYHADISLSHGESVLSQATASFTITGTQRILPPLELRTCTDSGCAGRTSVFSSGSVVHLTYLPVVADMKVTATVQGPGGAATAFALPGEFIARDEGVYVVSATATKEGYASEESRLEFGVIAAPVTLIESRGIPVANKPLPFPVWLIGGIGAVAIIGLYAAFRVTRKRRQSGG